MTIVSDEELLEDLRRVFRGALSVDPMIPIDRETRFFADLGLASIDAVVLGEAVQEHFARPIPFHELLSDLGKRAQRDLAISELIDFLRFHLGQPKDLAVTPGM